MPAITICPLCRKSLVVPTGLDAAARVRCPLCESEYGLHLVLGDVVEVPLPAAEADVGTDVTLPPEFVPVAHVALRMDASAVEPEEILSADASANAPADESFGESAAVAAGGGDAAAQEPIESLGSPLAPFVDGDGPSTADSQDGFTLAPSVTAARPVGPDDVYAVSGHDDDDPGFVLAHTDQEIRSHASPTHDAPHEAAHLDFLHAASHDGDAGLPVSRALSDLRAQQQRNRPSHALAKFVGVAVAGALGVSLAYLAMSWANPAKFDFLHIWGRAKSASPANGDAPARSTADPTDDDEARWR